MYDRDNRYDRKDKNLEYNLKTVWYEDASKPEVVDGNPVKVVESYDVPTVNDSQVAHNESGTTVIVKTNISFAIIPSGQELDIADQANNDAILETDLLGVVGVDSADLNNIEIVYLNLNNDVVPTKEQINNISDYKTRDALFFEAHLEKTINGGTPIEVQTDGSVTISVKIPNEYVRAGGGYLRTFKVAHFNSDGTVKEYVSASLKKVNGKYYVRFTVSSFSQFAICYRDVEYNVPDTATSTFNALPYTIIIAGLGTGALLLKKKREENN